MLGPWVLRKVLKLVRVAQIHRPEQLFPAAVHRAECDKYKIYLCIDQNIDEGLSLTVQAESWGTCLAALWS